MGRFFFNVQIKNKVGEYENFIELFNTYMESKGYVQGEEEDASEEYILAFSENMKWVTVYSPNYKDDEGYVSEEARSFSKVLSTYCVATNVVDSDFAMLELYHKSDRAIDMLVVGDATGYMGDRGPKGNRKCWESLLMDGVAWEQFQEVCNMQSAFVETSLAKLAPLLGMDSKHVTSEYDDIDSMVQDETKIIPLYFKKRKNIYLFKKDRQSKEVTSIKNMTINAAFKEIIGKVIEPMGFKKIKGRQPYYVRVVGDEIIHVIACVNRPSNTSKPEWKAFQVYGGIATVYRPNIDLTTSVSSNSGWLSSNMQMHKFGNTAEFYFNNFDEINKLGSFDYCNEQMLVKEMKRALQATNRIMLPILNKVIDMQHAMDYLFQYRMDYHIYNEKTNFGRDFPDCIYNEGLVLIKNGKLDEYIACLEASYQREIENKSYMIETGRTIFDMVNWKKEASKNRAERIKNFSRFFSDEELHFKVIKEMEQRKVKNTEILRSYGLEI